MMQALKWFINSVNQFHHWVLSLNDSLSINLTDKQLHFILFGLFALICFIVTHALFKRLAQVSLRWISFIFTFTVIFALALAIEFGQGITKTGIMDFEDVLYGLYGFITFMVVYHLILTLASFFKKR